jgi:hypothetical protein
MRSEFTRLNRVSTPGCCRYRRREWATAAARGSVELLLAEFQCLLAFDRVFFAQPAGEEIGFKSLQAAR